MEDCYVSFMDQWRLILYGGVWRCSFDGEFEAWSCHDARGNNIDSVNWSQKCGSGGRL